MTRGIGFFGASGAAPSAPLDSYTANLWGAYALLKLLSAYSGPAIRVRRSSDNAEQDIGFSGSSLDTTALSAFVGSNSAYVRTFYDQSGAANNLGQATTTKQPRIVNAGTFDASLVFDGTDDCLTAVNASGNPTGATVALRGTRRTATARQMFAESDAGSGGTSTALGTLLFDYDTTSNTFRSIAATNGGANLAIAPFSGVLTVTVMAARIDFTGSPAANQSDIFSNGTVSGGAKSGAGSISTSAQLVAGTWNIGARNNGASFPASLDLYKLVIYEAAKTSAQIALISAAL